MSITALQIELRQKMEQLNKETRTFEVSERAVVLSEDVAEIAEKLSRALDAERLKQMAKQGNFNA